MTIASRWRDLAPELRTAFVSCRTPFLGVAAVSGIINLLMLTGPLFMLQVYDRVLPSRSVPTLLGLCFFALILFLFFGALDALRGRVLTRISREIEAKIAPRAFDAMVRTTVDQRAPGDEIRVMRDLDSMRSFLASPAIPAFFDLPWMPLYVAVCFLFHPAIGWMVLLGALALCGVTYVTEVLSRAPEQTLLSHASKRRDIAETTRRNAELVQACGMQSFMTARWLERDRTYQAQQLSLSDVVGGFGTVSRTFRMILQSAVLAMGAYLVINQQATAGVMLAATILSIRALAPVETVIANWRNFIAARQGVAHLSQTLNDTPQEQDRVPLPRAHRSLHATSLTLSAPGSSNVILHDVSFALEAGTALGVIGPTGSGKSSLARALVGVWRPMRGVIRLDGARLDQWSHDALGSFVGYLPQEVELFKGSVAQNITRFHPEIDSRKLMEAAQAAAVHDVVLRLPNGYQSDVGEEGALLSGGQRQRIALARALYGQPFLLVLDEPNANLDKDGEAALAAAIQGVKQRGGIVVIVTHRPNILAIVDNILILNEGRMQAFGTCDRIIASFAPASAESPKPEEDSKPAELQKPTAPKRRARHVRPVA